MNASTDVYVALGSNLGDRLAFLRQAVEAFKRHPNVEVIAASHVYESPAHTLTKIDSQPHYLNAVVQVRTALNPLFLLEFCHEIERAAGRIRHPEVRWMSRTLDLDILIFGNTTLRHEDVVLPHPRLAERRFVLRPLADIAPDLEVPAPFSATVRRLLEDCPDRGELVRMPFSLLDQG